MYVTEHLERANNPLFSYEIIPPQRGSSAQDILSMVEQVLPYQPPFIDVTSHPAEAYYDDQPDGTIRRRVRRKRPGTISICGIIQNRYNIDTVPHILCRGFTREESEDVMIELNYLGIHNVLAIRGDEPNYHRPVDKTHSVNVYAIELVEQLNDLKRGKYLEDLADSSPIEMCIGVGGYPEKHFESPNVKTDVSFLRSKVLAGADYVVSQMFFDNQFFYRFVAECRKAEVDVPIIPGIKIINSLHQLNNLPRNFYVTIPEPLVDEIHANPKHVKEIGLKWTIAQARDLLEHGVKCLHFYIMNDANAVTKVIDAL
jgi:methylenetetrahydrofolate reductase (NADPH)